MNKAIHPQMNTITVVCSSCKTKFEVKSTRDSIKVELCSHCHPFYTGEQKIIDTANKVKDFERRRESAAKSATERQAKPAKVRKSNKVNEIRPDRPLTLRDMLKSAQQG